MAGASVRWEVMIMSLKDIFLNGGGILLILMTLVQIAPIKINPWSAIAKLIGRAINGEVLKKLDSVEKRLDCHITTDDRRTADRQDRKSVV